MPENVYNIKTIILTNKANSVSPEICGGVSGLDIWIYFTVKCSNFAARPI